MKERTRKLRGTFDKIRNQFIDIGPIVLTDDGGQIRRNQQPDPVTAINDKQDGPRRAGTLFYDRPVVTIFEDAKPMFGVDFRP